MVLEIPTTEQSEERVSYGAEPRQAGRALITSGTAKKGKSFQLGISNSNFKEKQII